MSSLNGISSMSPGGYTIANGPPPGLGTTWPEHAMGVSSPV